METPKRVDHKIKITLLDFQGEQPCKLGYKPGSTWVVENNRLPAHFCLAAFNSIYSSIVLLRNGGSYWWAGDGMKDAITSACPCPDSRARLEIRRLPMD
jgi:uncharacterized repeat protein (TIGR04076 family)